MKKTEAEQMTCDLNRVLVKVLGPPKARDEFHHAKGYLEAIKKAEEFLEGYRLILKSKCCPDDVTKHGNTCPKWIAKEALDGFQEER